MASRYRSSIQLFTEEAGTVSNRYYTDVGNVDSGSYTRFKVTKESGDGAVWLVYSEPNYGRNRRGSCKIAYPDETGMINAGFIIKSMQAFNITQPCICLFEHSEFRGNKLPTSQNVDDITKQFPPGEVSGMSSAIATSGLWSVYTRPAGQGPHQEVNALGRITTVPIFKQINDKVQSIKLERASQPM